MKLIRRRQPVKTLTDILLQYGEIAFAYLFGSYVKGTVGEDSDLDVAIYFTPRSKPFDLEDEYYFESEDDIWSAVEKKTGLETDLIVLNRSPATVCAAVLLEGKSLFIRDRYVHWDFFLRATTLAEEFRSFEREFVEIKNRSLSLSEIDKNRLIRIKDFLTGELEDCKKINTVTKQEYFQDSIKRRNIERLIENLVNCSIDIAKIILSSEKKQVPQTYRETVENLGLIEEFDTDILKRLSAHVKLRNILAHEYLDIKYKRVKDFLTTAIEDYTYMINVATGYIERQ